MTMFKCVPAIRRILSDPPDRAIGRHGLVLALAVALAFGPVHTARAQGAGQGADAVALPFVLRGSLDASRAELLEAARELSRATSGNADTFEPTDGLVTGATVPSVPPVAAMPADTFVTGSVGQGDGEEAFREWFRYGPEVEQDWRVSAVFGEPFTVRISPRRSVAPGRAGKRHRVFVLYPRLSSAYDTSITQILSVFAEKGIAAEITVMNFQRDGARAQAALEEAQRLNSDLIFAMGSESTAWLWENFRDGPIPVVSVCSKDPVILGQAQGYDRGTDTNFAFTSLNMPVEAQLAYVFGLKPDLKNLAILVDANNVSAVQTQSRPIAQMARRRGVRVVELALEDRARAREELAEMVGGAVKSMRLNDPGLDNSIFWITGSTAVFREIATINEHANRVPVLSVVPEVVQPGDDSAALSVGISFKSNAHLAALYGSKVLSGERAVGSLKVGVPSPPDIAINFKRVREIGLRMPFSFFEGASTVIDYEGVAVRYLGKKVKPSG